MEDERLKSLADKWLPILTERLGWRVKVATVSVLSDGNGHTDKGAAAATASTPEYMMASMHWSVDEVQALSDEELRDAFLHEMGHIFVAEMADPKRAGDAKEERCVTMLARAFAWFYEQGATDERK